MGTEKQNKIPGKVVKLLYEQVKKYQSDKGLTFSPEAESKMSGTDLSKNKWVNEILDIVFGMAYKQMKEKGIKNPPNSITKYFFLRDAKFWQQPENSKNILLYIMKRNLDNEKMIYNYKNKIFCEHNKEQLKIILYKRGILQKKAFLHILSTTLPVSKISCCLKLISS